MSVVKGKRTESKFEVYNQYTKMRKKITEALLVDFGYRADKSKEKLLRQFGVESEENLTDEQKVGYERVKIRNEAFSEWFIKDERDAIINLIREIGEHIYKANSIYAEYYEEIAQRRNEQELAIGCCMSLVQELQYCVETLPVDINKYLGLAGEINTEIKLIRGWRKSDATTRKRVEEKEIERGRTEYKKSKKNKPQSQNEKPSDTQETINTENITSTNSDVQENNNAGNNIAPTNSMTITT